VNQAPLDVSRAETPALPGYLEREYRRCGVPGCRCARGNLHGPYFRRVFWQGGHRRKVYVRACEVERVRDAIAAWRGQRQYLRTLRRVIKEMMRSIRLGERLFDEAQQVIDGGNHGSYASQGETRPVLP
jgi:hypothetical protein